MPLQNEVNKNKHKILLRHVREAEPPSEEESIPELSNLIPEDGAITKSSSEERPLVAFDAYRNKPFHEDKRYVTFDGTKVNVGKAFNPDTGKVMIFLIHSSQLDKHILIVIMMMMPLNL